jgi:chromatin remodeling complex protein RSC6
MAAASASSLKMLATAPKAPTHVPPQIIKLVELAENLKSRLSPFKQANYTTGLCNRFQTLNKRLEDVKAEIIQRTSKKGGKRTRKNKKSHKKHAHKKRTHKKRTRHTRKH